jgi:hypothetical protein
MRQAQALVAEAQRRMELHKKNALEKEKAEDKAKKEKQRKTVVKMDKKGKTKTSSKKKSSVGVPEQSTSKGRPQKSAPVEEIFLSDEQPISKGKGSGRQMVSFTLFTNLHF